MSYTVMDISSPSGAATPLVDRMANLPLTLTGWTLHDTVSVNAGSGVTVWKSPAAWPTFYLAFMESTATPSSAAKCFLRLYDGWTATTHTPGTMLFDLSGSFTGYNGWTYDYTWGEAFSDEDSPNWDGQNIHILQSSEHLFLGFEEEGGGRWASALLIDKYTNDANVTIANPFYFASVSTGGEGWGYVWEAALSNEGMLVALGSDEGQMKMSIGSALSGSYALLNTYVVADETLHGVMRNTKVLAMGTSSIMTFAQGGKNWLVWPSAPPGSYTYYPSGKGMSTGISNGIHAHSMVIAY